MAMTDPHGRPLILVSWDGRSRPADALLFDATPTFELVLFDYSNGSVEPVLPAGVQATLMRQATQCKGEIYRALADALSKRERPPSLVGLIDDDVVISISDLHRLLHVGRIHGLHAYSAALTHDSHHTHRWMLQQTHCTLREVDWVEVMMPIYDGKLFQHLAPHLGDNVSSWGIDRYLVPTVQQVHGLTHTAIVDTVVASHVRAVTSGNKRYRHGRTAHEDAVQMKATALALLQAHRPELIGTAWYRRIFEQRHTRTRWAMVAAALGRPIRRWLESST